MLALSDLVFMSTEARVRCPFTRLGVAPEAASSASFPRLLGRQNATWALLSSEWLSRTSARSSASCGRCARPSNCWPRRCATPACWRPSRSTRWSSRSAPSSATIRAELDAARRRENEAFRVLLGGPANVEALMAFAERREPDFTAVDDSPITH